MAQSNLNRGKFALPGLANTNNSKPTSSPKIRGTSAPPTLTSIDEIADARQAMAASAAAKMAAAAAAGKPAIATKNAPLKPSPLLGLPSSSGALKPKNASPTPPRKPKKEQPRNSDLETNKDQSTVKKSPIPPKKPLKDDKTTTPTKSEIATDGAETTASSSTRDQDKRSSSASPAPLHKNLQERDWKQSEESLTSWEKHPEKQQQPPKHDG